MFETHALPTKANAWVVRGADLVVVNSARLAADVQAAFQLPAERVLHAPLPPFNAVTPRPKLESRAALGLDERAVIACYTGKMTTEHNEFLVQTAAVLKARIPHFLLLLVGGNPAVLKWTLDRVRALAISDVVFLPGFVAPQAVGLYQAAADVLVYHMPESMGIFRYTTPAKGYEYQAAERPIVATSFPLFGEVFGEDGERAIRVDDRTPVGLADGIDRALSIPGGGLLMIERAARFVRNRTWASRTEAILERLGA